MCILLAYKHAFLYLISCANIWSRYCFAKMLSRPIDFIPRKKKQKTFVSRFVPLACYPIIIYRLCWLCHSYYIFSLRAEKELASNSYLIWLFVSYLLVKFLLVDKRQTEKNTNKHTCVDVENCSMHICFHTVCLCFNKPKKFKEERKIVQFPEVSSKVLRPLTTQPILFRFVLVCMFWL